MYATGRHATFAILYPNLSYYCCSSANVCEQELLLFAECLWITVGLQDVRFCTIYSPDVLLPMLNNYAIYREEGR